MPGLSASARLVIMDEPTSSLDQREVDVLFNVIRQLKADGVSLIFVSHKLDELYEVCDRVTIMRDGRTIRTALLSEVDKLDLVSLMLGRDIARLEGHATAFGERHLGVGATLFNANRLAGTGGVSNVSFAVRRGEVVGFAGLLGGRTYRDSAVGVRCGRPACRGDAVRDGTLCTTPPCRCNRERARLRQRGPQG